MAQLQRVSCKQTMTQQQPQQQQQQLRRKQVTLQLSWQGKQHKQLFHRQIPQQQVAAVALQNSQ
jgi:hypothetical protein